MACMANEEVPGEEKQGPLDEGDREEPAHTSPDPLAPLNPG